jgi:hypothetical protein
VTVLGVTVDTGCLLAGITSNLNGYNPAIQSNVDLMNAVAVYDKASVVQGSYKDIAGEQH